MYTYMFYLRSKDLKLHATQSAKDCEIFELKSAGQLR